MPLPDKIFEPVPITSVPPLRVNVFEAPTVKPASSVAVCVLKMETLLVDEGALDAETHDAPL